MCTCPRRAAGESVSQWVTCVYVPQGLATLRLWMHMMTTLLGKILSGEEGGELASAKVQLEIVNAMILNMADKDLPLLAASHPTPGQAREQVTRVVAKASDVWETIRGKDASVLQDAEEQAATVARIMDLYQTRLAEPPSPSPHPLPTRFLSPLAYQTRNAEPYYTSKFLGSPVESGASSCAGAAEGRKQHGAGRGKSGVSSCAGAASLHVRASSGCPHPPHSEAVWGESNGSTGSVELGSAEGSGSAGGGEGAEGGNGVKTEAVGVEGGGRGCSLLQQGAKRGRVDAEEAGGEG